MLVRLKEYVMVFQIGEKRVVVMVSMKVMKRAMERDKLTDIEKDLSLEP